MRLPFPAALAIVLGACASSGGEPWTARDLRPAQDPPVAFVTRDGEQPVGDGCRTPLIDPRDQTEIRLVRSVALGTGGRGDYEVPQGRYGVGVRELLRIDCRTGQPLGIVAN